MKTYVDTYARRSGELIINVDVMDDDDDQVLGLVMFEEIGNWKNLYSATVQPVHSGRRLDIIRFPFDPTRPVSDASLKRMGIRGWALFQPAAKAAFGNLLARQNPRRNTRGNRR
jgi:hypothetical protein